MRRRHAFIRNYDAWGHLEMLLVSAVAAVLFIRLFLEITDYPQIGGSGLHIAHMLWGGLFMLVAIFILLSYVGKTTDRWAAIAGGLGFGIFIDEIGKFVTADNDYFFKPAVSLIYVCFVFLFLAMHAVHTRREYSPHEYLVNALQKLEEMALHDLDSDEKRLAMTFLKKSEPHDPLVEKLKALLEGAELVPPRAPRRWPSMRKTLRRLYRQVASRPQFPKIIIAVFVIQLLIKVTTAVLIVLFAGFGWTMITLNRLIEWSVGRMENLSFADIAQLISSLISGVFVFLGVALVRKSRTRAFQMFEQSILVSIFLTQVFSFYRDQFFALTGLILNIGLLILTRYLLRQETTQRLNSVTAAPAGYSQASGSLKAERNPR